MLNEENENINIETNNVNDINSQDLNKRDIKPLDSRTFPLWQNIVLFVVGCGGIYVLSLLASAITILLRLGSEAELSGAANFITYSFLIVALLGVLNKNIVRLFKDKKWPSILIGFGIGVGMIIFTVIYGNILNAVMGPVETNDNEKALRSFIGIYPITSIIFLGIIGPVCEELTYRVGLFNIVKKPKWVAFVVSIIIFAFMHFNFLSPDIGKEFLNLPSYLVSGAALAIAYHFFGFWGSLTAHMTNNLYSVLVFILATNLGLLK